MWPRKPPSHSCQTCPGSLAWGKELILVHKNPLREGYLDLATNRKRMPSQATRFSVLLLSCAAVLPPHLIARETLFLWQMLLWWWNCLCGTSLPCQKIWVWWLFSGWLAWEGGDSNHLRVCEWKECLASAAGYLMNGHASRLSLLSSQGAGDLSNTQAGQVPGCLMSFAAGWQEGGLVPATEAGCSIPA